MKNGLCYRIYSSTRLVANSASVSSSDPRVYVRYAFYGGYHARSSVRQKRLTGVMATQRYHFVHGSIPLEETEPWVSMDEVGMMGRRVLGMWRLSFWISPYRSCISPAAPLTHEITDLDQPLVCWVDQST
ncbi:hypothetical protein PHLCEN_2v6359 [Hermanssonia centrifuga]|uniref:Uncharacterized protein n=1 Tax=Hermanssonia centrifuga TaxID=98765 RepID=A0A2R6NZM1_9APHY|nr:hypothetical protein PHLCEN_2v6359 [Hermanssonia centrifuga]